MNAANKKLLILLPIITIGGVFSVHSFVNTVRGAHARYVLEDVGKAWEEAQKKPAAPLERVKDYLVRLKAIDTSYAPPEMKQALSDYIASIQKGLDALKAGGDASVSSKETADARNRMVAIIQSYE